MRKNIWKILIPVAILVMVLIVILILRRHSSFTYNDNYVNGNLAGNLYNGGNFCEKDGMIYFSNPDDTNALYSMTSHGDDLKKLTTDYATFINADDNYIYFVRNNVEGTSKNSFLRWNTNSLCRISKDGGDVTILDPDPCYYACLSGNYLYYMHYSDDNGSTLYKVKIDGTDRKEIFRAAYIFCDASDRYIFYHGVENDHNLYRFDTTTDTSTVLYEGNTYQPIVLGNYAYFMDPDNNYSLARLDLISGEKITLISDRIDCFTMDEDTIYYQKNDKSNPALCKASLDGTSEKIMSGNYTELNLTTNYLYFKRFNDETVEYRIATLGDTTMDTFSPGKLGNDKKK